MPANHIEVSRLEGESSGGSLGPRVLDEVGSLVVDASLGFLEDPISGGLAVLDDGGLWVLRAALASRASLAAAWCAAAEAAGTA